MVDAKKEKIEGKAAVRLARSMGRVVVARGAKVVTIDLKKEKPSDAELLAVLLGPSGNLRAPTLKAGTTLLVGFNPDAWESVLG